MQSLSLVVGMAVGTRLKLPMHADFHALFRTIKPRLEESNLFADVRIEPEQNRIRCDALASAQPAFYSIQLGTGHDFALYVALQTPARYLSQSIEADLMFTGDKLEELLHEELVDLGYDPAKPLWKVEHFRSEDKLYTFRSLLPVEPKLWTTQPAAELAVVALKAYEATFRPLGDMEAEDE